jgi:branched-chain amino acid transport system substrate-binding protein
MAAGLLRITKTKGVKAMGFARGIRVLACAVVLAASLGACVRRASPEATVDEIRIGEFSSLSGSNAPFGKAVHSGIQLAVDEANLQGGIGGRKVRLVSYDDRGEPGEAQRLVERLATSDKVLVALGEVATSLSLAAGPVAQRLQMPMVSPGSTHPAVTQVGNYVFRVCFTDPFQGAVMARFALNFLQFKKAALLVDGSSEYSRGLADHFSREYLASGGKILATGEFGPGEKDFKRALAPLIASRPDILFLPIYFTEVGTIATQARKLGYRGIFIGGDGWEGGGLRKDMGKALEGSYYSNHFSAEDRNPEVQSFVARYLGRYHSAPPALAAMGYDAARVALDAIRRAKAPSRPAIRDALASTRNFPGVTGIITMSPSRDAVKPAVVLKVNAKGPHQYVTTVNP